MDIKSIKDNYVMIDKKILGGNLKIFENSDQLIDFSRNLNLGHVQVLDAILYELAKYSKILATEDDLFLTKDDYGKYLRHMYPTKPYRYFGFLNIYSMKSYVQRYYDKKGLQVRPQIEKDFVSSKYFYNRIKKILDGNHVIVIEDRNPARICKYYNLIGACEDYYTIVYDGKIHKISYNNAKLENLIAMYFEIRLD